jgi:hypothetical protein
VFFLTILGILFISYADVVHVPHSNLKDFSIGHISIFKFITLSRRSGLTANTLEN